MLSAHNHRFPFRGITVAWNIDDSFPQQLRANRIADLPGSRVLTGFQLIKYVFSCFECDGIDKCRNIVTFF